MASARAVFSWIFSAAYFVSCLNWSFVRMFLARARISSTISLKTRLLLPVLASSISSLHVVSRVSFIFWFRSPVFGVFSDGVFGANSLRCGNIDCEY